jgi:ribosome-associated toxin RatA of RatAB toxin-antitoxin module
MTAFTSSVFRYQTHQCIGNRVAIIRSVKTIAPTTHSHTHQSILINIHPRHLYQIVNNVDRYKDFLPYCQESKILQFSQCGTMMDAVLRVGIPGLSLSSSDSSNSLLEERYVSRVRMIPADDDISGVWIVEAKSIQSNLFDSLKSRWQLSFMEQHDNDCDDGQLLQQTGGLGRSCSVNFEVEIQVSNPFISFTLDRVLKTVAKAQVRAFEERCRSISFDEKKKA